MKGPADHRSIVYRGVFSSQRLAKAPESPMKECPIKEWG